MGDCNPIATHSRRLQPRRDLRAPDCLLRSAGEERVGKKQRKRTLEQFLALAEENGVRSLVDHLLQLQDLLPFTDPYLQGFGLSRRAPSGNRLVGISVFPTAETCPNAVRVFVQAQNLSTLFGAPPEAATAFVRDIQALGTPVGGGKWMGAQLDTLDQVKTFEQRFRTFVAAWMRPPKEEAVAPIIESRQPSGTDVRESGHEGEAGGASQPSRV